MTFDGARFNKFLSELGLASSLTTPKIIRLYQGDTDTVTLGEDILEIREGDIRAATLNSGSPKMSFADLEAVMTISEKIKAAKFPALELHFSLENSKVVGVTGQSVKTIPRADKTSQELIGLPASSGKVTAVSTNEMTGDISGKIIVLKNSKELPLLMKKKPAGIILEEGNLLSHASILAREAGIPAIVKVRDATKIIQNGSEITLNADEGTISIRKPR
ncbi:MAG: PEP-utilizing enzyme [Bdellovibrionota bacterium]